MFNSYMTPEEKKQRINWLRIQIALCQNEITCFHLGITPNRPLDIIEVDLNSYQEELKHALSRP